MWPVVAADSGRSETLMLANSTSAMWTHSHLCFILTEYVQRCTAMMQWTVCTSYTSIRAIQSLLPPLFQPTLPLPSLALQPIPPSASVVRSDPRGHLLLNCMSRTTSATVLTQIDSRHCFCLYTEYEPQQMFTFRRFCPLQRIWCSSAWTRFQTVLESTLVIVRD